MLNLSHAVNTREDSEFRTRTNLEPPTFASGPFLGNIGGPVHTFSDYPYDDEVDGNVTEDGNGFQAEEGTDGSAINAKIEYNATSSSTGIEDISA